MRFMTITDEVFYEDKLWAGFGDKSISVLLRLVMSIIMEIIDGLIGGDNWCAVSWR